MNISVVSAAANLIELADAGGEIRRQSSTENNHNIAQAVKRA